MSENTPEKPQEQAPPEESPAPVGADLPEVSDDDEATGYAVYDHTLLKYVTGVTSKAEATKIAKAGPEGHQLEARKV